MAKTLREARNDDRVYLIDKIEDKYEIMLNDGYIFKNGTYVQTFDSIREIWLALDYDVIPNI